MYQEISKTSFLPKRPMMVWDGECNFCKYWISIWKSKTGENISYETYQNVITDIPDIQEQFFEKAVRLIELDGRIFGGPDAAFRSMLYYKTPVGLWHRLYHRFWLFRKISDYGYKFVTEHRTFMLTLSKMMFGSNPLERKFYWLWYLSSMITALIFLLLYYV